MRDESSVKPWIDRLVLSHAMRSGYFSLLVHLLVGIGLALLAIESRPKPHLKRLVIEIGRSTVPALESESIDTIHMAAVPDALAPSAEATGSLETVAAALPPAADAVIAPPEDAALVPLPILKPDLLVATAVPAGGPIVQTISARPQQPGTQKSAAAVGTFVARRGRAKGEALRLSGGSAASEAAVERGLNWLARHQAVDGSWQFDLAGCRCDGACRDAGTLTSATASTAIAVLPFLGAGSTHIDGPHQQTVSRAIYYLLSCMKATPRGGDFCEGTMYGHGVTALALAEALGMTNDELLVPYVRDAVRFIETSQDMHGGGWRYLPGQAGDITVTAWQLVALKSAALAGVAVPSPTIEGVRRFLDSVQTQNGAAYGYRTPAAKPCTSAIGLLCRMYTGWGEEEDKRESLQRGITNLAKPGPSPAAIYQNFYLSQALLQIEHPVWPRWNAKNRTQIIAQQASFGHEMGSWFFADADTAPGGRLAHTALAVLTLEVYYRLLPIFQQVAVERDF